MRQKPEYRLPPLGALFRWGVVIAGALYVLVHYGLSGLYGFAILAGLVLLSAWMGSREDARPRKPMPNVFNEQKFGPTTEDLYYDPGFRAFPGNCYHKNFDDKD